MTSLALLTACSRDATAPVDPPEPDPPAIELSITGTEVPEMASFDRAMADFMERYDLVGGAVGVMHEGRLIYARGFGYADVEKEILVKPDALFRIASVSKPITSAAIMKLVEQGRIGLEDRVMPWLEDLPPAEGASVDPRWEQITIRHLLNHTGGWDRTKPNTGFDPMDRHSVAAAAVGAPAPASAETIIRYMKGIGLDFDPGTKHVYSNFGYAILGRIIERASGMGYEEFARTYVLQPVGANRTRSGRTRMSDAWPDEVKYYLPDQPGLGLTGPLGPSVFPGEGLVPIVYGGFHLEAMAASGAWVSSTVDLLRFIGGVDGRTSRPDILSPELISEMTGRGITVCSNGSCYYAAGWIVRPFQDDANWWHSGALPGSATIAVRTYNNFAWVALFNARSWAPEFGGELDGALWGALQQVKSLPTHDLFPAFR